MTKPTTEQLKQTLNELVQNYNKAIDVQQKTKEQIIAVHAVIQDRELEDGNTDNTTSASAED